MSFSLNHFLSAFNVVPILFFAAVFNLFSWRLTLASLEVAIFYKAATLPCENFSLASLNFSKIVKTKQIVYHQHLQYQYFLVVQLVLLAK